MPVLQYKKGVHAQLSTNFSSLEWDCPCDQCILTLIDLSLIEKLESIREILSAPIRINSGYRCASYQADLAARGYETAVGISQHQLGKAADIMSEPNAGTVLCEAAAKAGFRAIGVGGTWIHCDLRDDKDRRWFYTKR